MWNSYTRSVNWFSNKPMPSYYKAQKDMKYTHEPLELYVLRKENTMDSLTSPCQAITKPKKIPIKIVWPISSTSEESHTNSTFQNSVQREKIIQTKRGK